MRNGSRLRVLGHEYKISFRESNRGLFLIDFFRFSFYFEWFFVEFFDENVEFVIEYRHFRLS